MFVFSPRSFPQLWRHFRLLNIPRTLPKYHLKVVIFATRDFYRIFQTNFHWKSATELLISQQFVVIIGKNSNSRTKIDACYLKYGLYLSVILYVAFIDESIVTSPSFAVFYTILTCARKNSRNAMHIVAFTSRKKNTRVNAGFLCPPPQLHI